MLFSRRPSARFNRGRISGKTGPAGIPGGPPPAVPVLTVPAGNVNAGNGMSLTLSATSTDGDLTRIDWILDPSGAATVVATDSVAPYSQTWVPSGVSDGAHTLVARAVRGAQSTDSTPITITFVAQIWTRVSSVTCLRAWQSDFGMGLGGTPLASGTTPPAVTFTGAAPNTTIPAIRIEIQTTGALGVGTFRYGIANTGAAATWIEQNVTLPGGGTYAAIGVLTGLTLNFPAGTYTSDNVYQATLSSWVDFKNSTSAAQATASKQPRPLAFGAGPSYEIRGDGSNDSMLESTIDLPAPGTTPTFIYAILRQATWTTNKVYLDSGPGTEGCTVLTGAATPSLAMFNATLANSSNGATVASVARIWAHFTASTSDAFKAGAAAEVSGTSAGVNNPSPGIRMFAALNDTAFANGSLLAAFYFNGRPTPAELSAMDALASSMYGALV